MEELLLRKTLEFKEEEGANFSGYASIFNVIDSHGDIILHGAFKTSIDTLNIKLLWQHEVKMPIGTITFLEENSKGLYVKGKIITSTIRGQEAYELMKRGAIDGLSIGYQVLDSFQEGKTRYITEVKLWEVSIVTFPSNYLAKIDSIIEESATEEEYLEAKAALNKANYQLIKLLNSYKDL